MGAGAKLSPAGGRAEQLPGFEGHYMDVDGTTIGFETIEEAADFTPMYRGLPDDLCQSHHWGYVIEGRMIMHRPEGDVVVDAGDAYYVAPGHTGESGLPGTRVVEFSPTAEYQQTMAVVAKNLEAMS
ncbi:MAG: cupin domain-containing protein [Actinomycetota bacterium]